MDKAKTQNKIMVTGGGSGGHVAAASSVIDYLTDEAGFAKENIVYLGGKLGMIGEKNATSIESKMIAEKGLRFISIRGGKLHRFFTLDQFKQFWLILMSFFDAWKVLKKEKPALLFSTGGFVAVAPVIAAKLMKIPVVIHEQTVVSGLANRITGRFADKVCISHESSKKYFNQSKVVLTGNPISKKMLIKDIDKVSSVDNEFKEKFKNMLAQKDRYPIIFLTGGAQGAHQLNEIILQNLDQLLEEYQLILQVGDNKVNNDYDWFVDANDQLSKGKSDRLLVTKFMKDEIGPIMNNSDYILTRGGANALDEVDFSGIRAMIVPLDGVSGDEQYKNSQRLVKSGQAVVYRQGEFNTAKLLEGLDELKKLTPSKQKQSEFKAQKLIADVLLKYLM